MASDPFMTKPTICVLAARTVLSVRRGALQMWRYCGGAAQRIAGYVMARRANL